MNYKTSFFSLNYAPYIFLHVIWKKIGSNFLQKKIILASYNINSINVIFSSSEFFNVLGYDNLWKFFLILTLLN